MAGHDVIQSLEQIKLQVQEELRTVREYRALLNIRKAIAELSGIEEMTGPLEQVASALQLRMKDISEYRALETVEKSIGDMSEVLELLQAAARKRNAAPKDVLAGVKFAPGLVGKAEVKPAVQPAAAIAQPATAAAIENPDAPAAQAPAQPPRTPADAIEADIANVLRVGERLRLKN
jgi:hypothetical protein